MILEKTMIKTQNTPILNQIPMPGMPNTNKEVHQNNFQRTRTGENVLYTGNIYGGPRYGSHGIVKKVFLRKAVVDLGISGTWHIPHFLLSTPKAA